jgi:hypothetical protein
MASTAAVSRRRAAEIRSPGILEQGSMRSNGQESLSTDAQATLVWRRLLWRSGIAILVITGLILVVSLLPFPTEKKQAIHRHGCSDHAHLRHVIVLHRHGMCELRVLWAVAVREHLPCACGGTIAKN